MSSIDERIVKMTFDNASFEKNAGATLSTLDKLKSALNFEGASKGLNNLQSIASSFSMDAIATGVQTVANHFTMLGIVSSEVLHRLVDTAIDAGTSITKALTIQPVLSGMQEYETQINAVQTILANTKDKLVKNEGLTEEHDQIERINDVLDDLNKYADMTIYNFTEMTRNIGTFTAAGVDLDQSQRAIKGIANLAAVSGSDSNQASRAMYQLSQALAAGTVHLQDWNSVVNAGMGGEVFQNAIKETARVHGVAIDEMLESTGGSFRALLNAQDWGDWLTSDILLESLEKFTAGSEGFTKEQVKQQEELWRVRGYSEEQIKDLIGQLHILTDEEERNTRAIWKNRGYSDAQVDEIMALGKMSTEAATKVKTLSQLIETVGEAMQSGWTQSWEYIIGDFEQAKILWTEISDIMNLYISKSAEARNNVLKGWSQGRVDENGVLIDTEGTGREKVIAGIRNAFQGVFEIILQVNEAWDKSFLHKGMADDISITSEKLINLSQQFMIFTQEFKNALVSNGEATPLLLEIEQIAEKVFGGLRNVYDTFVLIGNILSTVVTDGITSFVEKFEVLSSDGIIYDYLTTVTNNLKTFVETLESNVFTDENVIAFFDGLASVLKTIFEIKMEAGLAAWDAFDTMFRAVTNDYADVGTFFKDIGDGMTRFSESLESLIHTSEGGNRFTDMFKAVADNIQVFIEGTKNVDLHGFNDWITNLEQFMAEHPDVIFGTLQNVLEGLANIGETLYAIFAPLLDALFTVFKPEDIINGIHTLSEKFREFTEAIKIDPANMTSLQQFFTGIFDVIKLIIDIINNTALSAFESLGTTLGKILPDQGSFITNLGSFGDSLSKLVEKIREAMSIGDGGSIIKETFDVIGQAASDFISKITGNIDGQTIFDRIKAWIDSIDFNAIVESWRNFISGFTNSSDDLQTADEGGGILENLGKAIAFVANCIIQFLSEVDIPGLISAIASIFTANTMMKFLDFFMQLPDKLNEFFNMAKNTESLGAKFIKTLDSIKSALESWQETLRVAQLLGIAGAIGIIAYSVYQVSLIPEDKIMGALGALAGGIAELLGTIVLFNQMDKKLGFGKTMSLKTLLMLGGLAATLKTLAKALTIVSAIDPERLWPAVKALGAIIGEFTAMMAILSISGVPKIGVEMLLLSISINILTVAIEKLGSMKPEELSQGLIGLTVSIGILVEALANIPEKTEGLISAAVAMILMGAALVIVAQAVKTMGEMRPEQLAAGLAGVAVSLYALVKSLNELTTNTSGLIPAAIAMILMGAALVIVAQAVKTMGTMKPEELAAGLAGIAVSLYALVKSLNELTTNTSGLIPAAIAMILMGAALNIVAQAVKTMGEMKPEELAAGLGAIAVSLYAMVKAINSLTTDTSGLIAASIAMILMGAALNIVAQAVNTMGTMKPEELAAGLGAVAIALIEIIAATNMMPDGAEMLVKGISLTVFGAALLVVAAAVEKFAAIPWDQSSTGLKTMAIALAEIVIAVDLLPDGATLMTTGIGLMIIGAALAIISQAIVMVSEMKPEQLAAGLIAMGVGLFELSKAVNWFDAKKMDNAIVMMAIAAALLIFAPALKLLSTIPFTALVVGLTALGAGFLIMGKVAELLQPTIPALLQFAGALAIMGVGLFALVAAFTLLGTLLAGMGPAASQAMMNLLQLLIDNVPKLIELASVTINSLLQLVIDTAPKLVETIQTVIVSVVAGLIGTAAMLWPLLTTFITLVIKTIGEILMTLIPTAIEVLTTFISSLLTMVQELLPQFMETITAIIQSILQMIQDLAPEFMETITAIIKSILDTIQALVPEFAETVTVIVTSLITTFNTISPQIITAILGFITNLLVALAKYVPEMTNAGLQIIQGFLQAIADNIEGIVTAAIDIVLNFCKGITERLDDIVDTAFKMIIGFIEGLAKAIDENHNALFDAVGHLITSIVNAIIDGVTKVVDAGSRLVGDFIDNFDAQQFMDSIYNAGKNLIQGFINGIGALGQGLWDAACNIANTAINAITKTTDEHSPSKVAFRQGQNYTQGYINGMTSLDSQVESSAGGVAMTAIDAMGAANNAQFSPSITPVWNDQDLQNGMNNYDLQGNISQQVDVNMSELIDNQNALLEKLFDDFKAFTDQHMSKVTAQVNDIGASMKQGFDNVSNMKVVLDSGTLVGELSPGIDSSLGSAAMLSRRGVV